MKKAQMETMGLVIIVILLVFIAIFALPFIIKERSKALDDNYMQLFSNNLRSVVLNTNICGSATVKDEILNCKFESPVCLSCSELGGVIGDIIEGSLGSLEGKINYKFSVDGLEIVEGVCDEKIVSSKAFIDDIEVKLELCYRR